MDRFSLHMRQLRHPLSDILARSIELLALQQRVEDPEIRLGIHARRSAETPSTVVARKVAINQMFHEVALAHAPVDQQILGKEGGDDHATPVVHVASVVELAHRCVDDGEAGCAGAPGFEEGLVVFPADVCIFGFEGLVHARGY